jgi:hypothetical protein
VLFIIQNYFKEIAKLLSDKMQIEIFFANRNHMRRDSIIALIENIPQSKQLENE